MYYDEETRPVEYAPEPVAQRPQPPKKRRGCFSCLTNCFVLSILGLAFVVFTGIVVTVTIMFSSWSAELEEGIARLEEVPNRETFETTRIYSRDGELLWEIFGEGNRTNVALADIPQSMINATIAVEDDTFYDNQGSDVPSLVAALIANFRNPNGRPIGASTITQQLVRHIAFDYDERTAVSYNRKSKEIVLAWLMTRNFTKDEILELYLNEIYYGNLAYGVEAAAQTYFGKAAKDLTVAEATLLAGLPQAPVDLDPLTNFEAAKQKQWLVLNLMAEEGYIGRDEVEPIYQTPLTFKEQSVSIVAPHFTTYVRQILEEQFGAEAVANGGLRVTTTIDLRYQKLAEVFAQRHVAELRDAHNLTNAALVALKPSTGEVLAMLGSVDYKDDTIDGRVNVTLTPQQPGSSIKPLTYAAAFTPVPETGLPRWQAGDVVWDVPVEYVQPNGVRYSPVNYDGRFHGPMRLREALANSYNVPAVLVLQDVGVPQFLDFAQKLGITSFGTDASQYGLALTLGGGELTPLELTAAYATFANEGYRVEPQTILKVENSKGEVLYQFDPNRPQEQVVDPRVAYLISDILADDAARVPAMGRTNPLDLPFTAAAKTGTTNDFRDNWTIGYTPGLAVGVWAGNTDNSEMINVSGLTGAAPLWSDFMQAIYGDYELMGVLANGEAQPPTEFTPPPGMERRPLCAIASITVGAESCTAAGEEWFITADTAAAAPTPSPMPDTVEWTELDPAVVVAPAVALPPTPVELVAASLQADDEALPPPLFCQFARGTAVAELPPDAAPQVFLKAPRNPESLREAYIWAEANGIAVLPVDVCNEALLALARDPNSPAVWRISSPRPGDEISGIVPIVGTADFDPSRVQFYKVELGIPQASNPNEVQWLTLGNTHNTSVVNGQLETLYAAGLAPGDYFIRLIVVQNDGNYVGEPYTVPLKVVN